jgi:hypothetical protein
VFYILIMMTVKYTIHLSKLINLITGEGWLLLLKGWKDFFISHCCISGLSPWAEYDIITNCEPQCISLIDQTSILCP